MKLGRITSFAQKNAEDNKYKYRKALDERKKLVRAEYASENPLRDSYKARGRMLDRKIGKLKSIVERS